MSKRTWQPPADAKPGDTFRAGRRLWSAAEDAILRAEYPDNPTGPIAVRLRRTLSSTYGRAAFLGLAKSAAYLATPAAGRLRLGGLTAASIACRFQTGLTPHNKGLRGRKGYAPGRMAETQFKPGVRLGKAAKNWKPIGSERISKDGYLMRKTHDALPPGISRDEANRLRQRRWKAVHVIVWEAAHGPLPKGHAVMFVNGDKRDIRLDNLALISRADNMRRNTVHNLPKPIAQAVQLLGALNRQIRRKEQRA